jgi:hypothetical protein
LRCRCLDSPDYIAVHDGANQTARLIVRLCNTVNGEQVVSTGKNMFIEFVSDARNERQGFAASYAFVPDSDEQLMSQQQQQQQQHRHAHVHGSGHPPHDFRPTEPTGSFGHEPLGFPVLPTTFGRNDQRGYRDGVDRPKTPGRFRAITVSDTCRTGMDVKSLLMGFHNSPCITRLLFENF